MPPAQSLTNKAVAAELGVHEPVGKWRRLYPPASRELSDEPRPKDGRAKLTPIEALAEVIERTDDAAAATHWSICSMAWESGLSHPADMGGLLAATNWERLQASSAAVRGQGPRHASGPICRRQIRALHEKSQIQALEPHTAGPADASGTERRTTTTSVKAPSLFAAIDVATGRRHRQVLQTAGRLRLPEGIDRRVPEGLDVHIVLDNYATHVRPRLVKAWLARHALACRPLHADLCCLDQSGWVRRTERMQAVASVHRSTRKLAADIRAFIEKHNENPKPFKWTKSADIHQCSRP